MMMRPIISREAKTVLWIVVICTAIIFFGTISRKSSPNFAVTEARFTDISPSGMQIMPASCASSPTYFHASLNSSTDGSGYILASGASEAGASAHDTGKVYCFTNSSANNYFVPGKTQSEMESMKAAPPPGTAVY